jgi:dienelactone hydrolase
MTQALTATPDGFAARTTGRGPGLPSRHRVIVGVAIAIAALVLSTTASTLTHLRLPDPTGSFAVGKLGSLLEDRTRPASATVPIDGPRQLRVAAWYPATQGTGTPAQYVSDLDAIADGLVASGEVSQLEASGLALIADPARAAADPAIDEPAPVVLLSPGNAANVEFYGALAEDLASHGYVVIGIDHPFQVAAVEVGGEVAVYPGDPPLDEAAALIPAKIDERIADMRFVLDRLETDAAGLAPLVGHLDLSRVGVMGHSNGGIAAAGACADARVDACANIDGQLAGGPFSARQDPSAPSKPLLFLTKETEIHPRLAELFEAGGPGTFRVVIPAATHDQFTDGAMFEPRLVPTANTADGVVAIARGFSRAFFDHELRGAPRSAFGSVTAPLDVQVYVYPLERPAS